MVALENEKQPTGRIVLEVKTGLGGKRQGAKMEYKNYFKIKKLSPRYNYYAIIDSADHMASSLFARNEIRVYGGEEYVRDNSTYRFIICRIRKKDNGSFLDAMEKLKSKMLLCGNTDYPEFCANFQEGIQKRREQNDMRDYFKQSE